MISKTFSWAVRIIAVLVLVVAAGAQTQAPMPEHFSGIISDYTPSIPSTKPNTAPTPPYEMRGHWSLHLNRRTGKADFSAIMAMEFSDYWLLTTPGVDPTNSALRGQHTHHITMTDAMPSDPSACPAYLAPTPTNPGFAFTGMADITGNGSPAPFQTKGGLSALQVCINGGSAVEFSNISLVFQTGAPAIAHFGSQAIHGVVRFPRKSEEGDKDKGDWDNH
jgi:hypothetical protein